MTPSLLRLIRLGALALCLFGMSGAAASAAYDCDRLLTRPGGAKFELLFGSKLGSDDEIAALCLKRVPVIKEVHFRAKGTKDLTDVSSAMVRSAITPYAREPIVVIDIEQWKTKGTDDVVADSVTRFLSVLRAAQTQLPDTKFGFYSMVPSRDYYRAVGDKGPAAYSAWQSENDRLKNLAVAADALFPSVYTFFREPPSRWATYARANIAEASRLAPGKPIYPFIWNRYHGSNKEEGKEPLEADFFEAQLKTLFETPEANGVVIWLISKEPWDSSANWVAGLQRFLDSR